MNDPLITPLINDALATAQDARVADSRYRKATVARQEAGKDKDVKVAAAHAAYAHAERTILDHLANNAVDQNITINHSSRFLHLWFDEAGARYRKAQVETQLLSPGDPLAAIQPSAPPMVIAYPVNNSSSLYGQSGGNFK